MFRKSIFRINLAAVTIVTALLGYSLGPSRAVAAECNVPSFQEARDFSLGAGYVHRVVVADFNKDDKPDIAVTTEANGSVEVLWGDGTGDFPSQTQLPVGSFSISLVEGDFNGDGNPDLAVASFREGSVYIYLSDGTGGFSGPLVSNAGSSPFDITEADFNGDGKLDLAVVSEYEQNVSVVLGDGTGLFAPPIKFYVGGYPHGINAGDVNRDGRPDLITSNNIWNSIAVFNGDGTGHFGAGKYIDVGGGPSKTAIADFNGDGNPDIPVLTTETVLLLGNGNGQFSIVTSPTGGGSTPRVADVNGDGKLDLVAAVSDASNTSDYGWIGYAAVFLGDGQGRFSPALRFLARPAPDLAVGDFNGDGKPDLVTANYFHGTVSVLLNAGNGLAVNALFDTTKAHKSGSTIPIALQLVDCAGANVSSASTTVTAADLRLVGGTTSASVVDSGNANPDYNFRYEPTLGGAGGGYIFNLSTKGLPAGTYALGVYIGSDRSLAHSINFEVK